MTAVYSHTEAEKNLKSQTKEQEEEQLVILPRGVEFDWSTLPNHYVYNEPFITHFANLLHLLLPAGEAFFIEAAKDAIPYIKDDKLYNDVQGFIGQETIHYTAHQGVLDFFSSKGIDTTPYTNQIEYALERLLGRRPHWSPRRQKSWMLDRVAIVAAAEHFTAFIGKWVVENKSVDSVMHPVMLDMLRWHGSEEVEHRAVCFNIMKHLKSGYFRQVRAFLMFMPFMAIYWVRGIRFMYSIDPELKGQKPHLWKDYRSAYRRDLLPSPKLIFREAIKYFRPSFHPDEMGGMDSALEYLAKSPAARTAY